jgi:hypothetical protein
MAISNVSKRARTEVYSDLDFKFKMVPGSGDVNMKTDLAAIRQSVINIIMTSKGERPFSPEFGSNIKSFLFEHFDAITKTVMTAEIKTALVNHEPRVKVLSVDIDELEHRHALRIRLNLQVKSPEANTTEIEFIVERLR